MLKMLARLLFSFTLILSLGYSQVFLAFSQGFSGSDVGWIAGEQVESAQKVNPAVFISDVSIHKQAQKQFLDLDSLVLEKDAEEKFEDYSLEVRLAITSLFLLLFSIGFRDYHTRFLRFYQNFSYTYSHRLHLYNRVFTI